MVNNLLLRERESLMTAINQLKEKLKKLPPGNLVCAKNGTGVKWYQSNGARPIYIPKSERAYAEKLALRKYYSYQLEELETQLEMITQIQNINNTSKKTSDQPSNSTSRQSTKQTSRQSTKQTTKQTSKQLMQSPGFQELLESYFRKQSEHIQTWIDEEYEHSTYYQENLIHKTLSGQYVRSKSEVIIANTLYQHKLPFRYECGINLGGTKFYPDFTILHPQTKQIIYWEHFGMMNDPTYRDSAYNKMKLFGDYQIIPSINLITTYETKSHPINSYKVEQLVQEYFGILPPE